jgi:hypothetical protein
MISVLRLLCAGCLVLALASCGIYSFTGASIAPGSKTVNVHYIDNKAPYNNPTLSQKLTDGLKQKITSQTGLAQINSDQADYVFSGTITGYSTSTVAATNVEQPATARLTITVNMVMKCRINPKSDFTQSFSRSEDFDASKSLDAVQDQLVTDINKQLIDDIFNRAFVNW